MSCYREFKLSLDAEKYLFSVKIVAHAQMLARLRCSSHYLRIETDRKHKIDRNERICLLCERNEVENECHFLMICPFFDCFRKKYIPAMYLNPPIERNFLKLMMSTDVNTQQCLAAFTYHAMKLRKEIYDM